MGTQILIPIAAAKGYKYIKTQTAKGSQELISQDVLVGKKGVAAEEAKVIQKIGDQYYAGEIKGISIPKKYYITKEIEGGIAGKQLPGRAGVYGVKVAPFDITAEGIVAGEETSAIAGVRSVYKKIRDSVYGIVEKGKVVTEEGKITDVTAGSLAKKVSEDFQDQVIEFNKKFYPVSQAQKWKYITSKVSTPGESWGGIRIEVNQPPGTLEGAAAGVANVYKYSPIIPPPSAISGVAGSAAKLSAVTAPKVSTVALKSIESLARSQYGATLNIPIRMIPPVTELVKAPTKTAQITGMESKAYFSKVGTLVPKTTERVVMRTPKISTSMLQAYATASQQYQKYAAGLKSGIGLKSGVDAGTALASGTKTQLIPRVNMQLQKQAQSTELKQMSQQLQSVMLKQIPRLKVVPGSASWLTPRVYPGTPTMPRVFGLPGLMGKGKKRYPYWLYGLRSWPVMSPQQFMKWRWKI
jgi:hypothetical protein